MELSNIADKNYIAIAIQTVLHNHRNHLHLFMDTDKYLPFIKEMSGEIIVTAQTYKNITESTVDSFEREYINQLKKG